MFVMHLLACLNCVQMVGGRCPLLSEILHQIDSPIEKRRLTVDVCLLLLPNSPGELQCPLKIIQGQVGQQEGRFHLDNHALM